MQEVDPVSQIYKAVGTDVPFFALVEEFYKRVEIDTVLRPLYPEDLGPGKEALALFLIQRTGGRQTYSEQKGHPRMRGRHMPFKIGIIERNAWVHNMNEALNMVPELQACKKTLKEFFESFATFMINQPD
jgi:hemoglobin